MPFPSFPYSRMEGLYRLHFAQAQAVYDLCLNLLGLHSMGVVIWQEWSWPMDVPLAYCIVTALVVLVPTFALLNQPLYPFMRSQVIGFWVPAGWHYNFVALVALSERAAAAAPVGPNRDAARLRLQRWMGQHTRFALLFWGNLGRRLPFWQHIAAQGGGVLAALMLNARHCRWTVDQHPGTWLVQLAPELRRVAGVRPPPPGSFSASPVGLCTVTVNFLQLAFGYLLPCSISLWLELKSRSAYIAQYQSTRERQGLARLPLAERLWQAGGLLSRHRLWQVPLGLLLSWRLAELAAAAASPDALVHKT